jgi:hypothetical protein
MMANECIHAAGIREVMLSALDCEECFNTASAVADGALSFIFMDWRHLREMTQRTHSRILLAAEQKWA